MGTIPGCQYDVSVMCSTVNIVRVPPFSNLSEAKPGHFNLEEYVGSLANAPALAPDFQGLAVLSPNGLELDLVSGAYAVTDRGSGSDTVSAYGNDETITGSHSGTTLNLYGSHDVANGSGQDTVGIYGNFDTLYGGGNDADTITGQDDVIHAGNGNDTITVNNSADTVIGGSGNDTISVAASDDSITAGSGGTVITVNGDANTVAGGSGHDTISVTGSDETVFTGAGSDSVSLFGADDTVTSGSQSGTNAATIDFGGNGETLVDGPHVYADTVVGFSEAAGDTIKLNSSDTASYALAHSTLVNGGQDTLITLNDSSTILLKGVTHIDGTMFH